MNKYHMMKQHWIIFFLILTLSAASVYFLFVAEVETPVLNQADGYLLVDEYATQPDTEDDIADSGSADEPETNLESLVLPFITTNTTEIAMPQVRIETSKGTITVELYPDDAPKAVENFLTLTQDGFYDGVIFHRVISGFMIQGGDPTGTGTGGPGYRFEDELDPSTPSYQRGYERGTLAMANSGKHTNGSQFFIMHQDNPLPHLYTIFGRVVDGMDVVDAIAEGSVDRDNRPLEEVVMETVTVVE